MVLAHIGHDAGALAALAIPVVAYGVVLFNRAKERRAQKAQAAQRKVVRTPADARRR